MDNRCQPYSISTIFLTEAAGDPDKGIPSTRPNGVGILKQFSLRFPFLSTPTRFMNLPRLLSVLFAIYSIGVLPSGTCRAMSMHPISFSVLVSNSTQILRVQVTDVSSRWDVSPNGRVIHTYVACNILRTLKGNPESTITLRFLGGQVGDVHMEIPEMPSFQVGETYVVFVALNNEAFCPIVGVINGSYPLLKDASTQVEHVLRGNRQPLASVDDIALPLIASNRQPWSHPAAGSGLSRAEFEDAIVMEASHANKQ
jgi:hypothetical protein